MCNASFVTAKQGWSAQAYLTSEYNTAILFYESCRESEQGRTTSGTRQFSNIHIILYTILYCHLVVSIFGSPKSDRLRSPYYARSLSKRFSFSSLCVSLSRKSARNIPTYAVRYFNLHVLALAWMRGGFHSNSGWVAPPLPQDAREWSDKVMITHDRYGWLRG